MQVKYIFLNLLLSYISIFLSRQNEIKDEFNPNIDLDMNFILEPRKVQKKFIKDTNRNPFIFIDKGIYNDLLVNFYSLSCSNIELSNYTSQNISSIKLNGNSISMRIKNNSFQTADIIIKEKVSLINGNNKYENKKDCPLIINTIDVSSLSLSVEVNEPTILYFDENYLEKINLSYQIEEITKIISYISLSFTFNNVFKFNINI